MTKLLIAAAIIALAWYFLRRPKVVAHLPEAEAREILGVSANADAEAIHRGPADPPPVAARRQR